MCGEGKGQDGEQAEAMMSVGVLRRVCARVDTGGNAHRVRSRLGRSRFEGKPNARKEGTGGGEGRDPGGRRKLERTKFIWQSPETFSKSGWKGTLGWEAVEREGPRDARGQEMRVDRSREPLMIPNPAGMGDPKEGRGSWGDGEMTAT